MVLTADETATTRLRAMRSAMGLSVRELARRMEIDASLVSRAERGLIATWPRFRHDAATALGLPEQVLFPPANDEPRK